MNVKFLKLRILRTEISCGNELLLCACIYQARFSSLAWIILSTKGKLRASEKKENAKYLFSRLQQRETERGQLQGRSQEDGYVEECVLNS